jgi:glycosyltransferase involved in cell wall biosynthesis
LVYIDTAARGLRQAGVDPAVEYIGYLRSLSGLWRARRRIRLASSSFDVVHAQYGSACGLATTAADGAARVLSLRGNDWNLYDASLGFFFVHTRLARLMTLMSLGRYDGVVTVSHRMEAEVAPRVPRAVTTVLPSPIDLTRFMPLSRDDARARLGCAGQKEPWVLFNAVDLNDPIKRYPLARQAFEIANARAGGRLTLRVANGIPHAEMPLFVAACDVIVCTSETEGWPNCIKEALACDVPFVATDVSDLKQVASVAPPCRVTSADPAEIARQLLEVLAVTDDGRRRPFLREVVQTMRLDRQSRQLIDLYDAVIRRRRDGRGPASVPRSPA